MKRKITIVSCLRPDGKGTRAVEEYELDVSEVIMDDLRRWLRWAQKYADEKERQRG